MNEIGARAERRGNRYYGFIRKVHKADWEPVSEFGVPIPYTSAEEAEIAAWRALKPHINSIMRRDGDTIKADARAAAERLFTRTDHGKAE